MSWKPPKSMSDIEAGLQMTSEINSQLGRINPIDRMNLLNTPKFNWVHNYVNPLRSSPITPPLGGMVDPRNEVNSITGPFYSTHSPIKNK